MQNYIIRGAYVYMNGGFSLLDIAVSNRVIIDIAKNIEKTPGVSVFDFNGCHVFPGFVDVHVHLREPGLFYKETIASGTMAAAHGGFTSVCSMPNVNPVPDSIANIKLQLDIIEKTANVKVYPYGAITIGENGEKLSDMEGLSGYAVAFSDDGKGVQNDKIMEEAMLKAKVLGKIIAAHCEDNSLINGGYIHDGEYALKHGHKGIPSESEWKQIERDVELAGETGVCYHVCHVSTKESVDIIRKAKARGIKVTCETAPHYIAFDDNDIKEDGAFKMNPPIRSKDDRLALIEGIKDGTIDIIATDHAPHSFEEKSKGLRGSVLGIPGLETAFPVMYTKLVKTNIIALEKLIEIMQVNPGRIFGIGNSVKIGQPADLTVFNLNNSFLVNPDKFYTKAKITPFKGMKLFGECIMTMVDGNIVWQKEQGDKNAGSNV
ncbi:MAG: dihydroorotase [Lachnospiraceae bacterium]|nr:dihydroorotase [Lachnospiraceae bacterium]